MLGHGPFVEYLINEHKAIEKLLATLETEIGQTGTVGSLERIQVGLQNLRYLVEDVHHKNEEELLFPELYRWVDLRSGGPECARFMTLKLYSDACKGIFAKGKKHGQDAQALLKRYKTELLDTPLVIPAEEHIACQIAIHIAECEIANLLNQDAEASAELRKILVTYISLMRDHIQKENECLFVLADKHIPLEVQEKMLKNVTSAKESYQRPSKGSFTEH